MKVRAFWDITRCSLVEVERGSSGDYCFIITAIMKARICHFEEILCS